LLTAAVALALAAGGLVFVMSAFRGDSPPATGMSAPHDTTSAPVVQGTLAIPETRPAHIVGSIPVGTTFDAVSAVAYGFGSVWVAGFEGNEGVIVRVDPSTHDVVATIPTDATPPWETGGGGLRPGLGSMWVTGSGRVSGEVQAIVQRIDPATNEVVETIPLGGDFGADLAIQESSIWVSLFGDDHSEVVRVDSITREIAARFPLENEWVRQIVATDAGVVVLERVWGDGLVADNVLTVIDPATNDIVTTVKTYERYGMDRYSLGTLLGWDSEMWGVSGHLLVRVDPGTGEVVEEISVEGGTTCCDVAATDEGIWLGSDRAPDGMDGRILSLFDPSTRRIERAYRLPGKVGGIAMAVGPNSVWYLAYDGNLTHVALR
jgi:hypothetical protein